MSDAFRSDVFHEAGEAIGNVGRRLLKRRNKRGEAEQALRRWLKVVPAPVIPPTRQAQSQPEDDVIEGVCRVIDDQKGEEHD